MAQQSLFALACIVTLIGCATEYRFVSTPENAAVYQRTPTSKVLIGETPIDYAKSALPTEAPFVVVFEREGYETREIAVTPTDNALTTVAVQLKPKTPGGQDEGLKRLRGVVQKIFKIQEQIFQKRYVDALAGLKSLEEAEQGLVEVHVLRGSVYALLNNQDQARSEWQKAIEMDPSLEEVKVSLSRLPKADGVAKP